MFKVWIPFRGHDADRPAAPTAPDQMWISDDTGAIYTALNTAGVLSWHLYGGGGAFTSLSDAPSSYSGQAGKAVVVNPGETGLAFATIPGGSATYPATATLWHDESVKTAGAGTFTTAQGSSYPYAFVAYINPANNGDTFTHSFFIAAGTYLFSVLGGKFSSAGKIDWYIDGVLIASGQDWYNSINALNSTQTVSSVSIPTDGSHVLQGVVNGKNASSSGYSIQLEKMWFR